MNKHKLVHPSVSKFPKINEQSPENEREAKTIKRQEDQKSFLPPSLPNFYTIFSVERQGRIKGNRKREKKFIETADPLRTI